MHSKHLFCLPVLTIAALVHSLAVTASAQIQPRQGLAIHLRAAAAPSAGSGELASVRIRLENQSSLPLWHYTGSPADYRFALGTESRGPGGAVAPTRYGSRVIGSFWIPSRKSVGGPSPWLRSGKSKTWPRFPLARLYDLTLPGRYRFRFTTQLRLYTVTGAAAIFRLTGYKRTRIVLYWPPPGEPIKTGGAAKALPPLVTRPVIVTVAAPYGKLPSVAIEPAAGSLPIHAPAARRWLQVSMLGSGTAMPVMLRVWFCAGTAPFRLEMAGNPLVDFGDVQVDGPDGINGDELIKKPIPHYGPVPNWKPVPLTAYGKWLLKHPVTGLKAKRYTLKPGAIYKYAVPINLGCQFDMSLSGNYHVRLRLAHTHIWSEWATVVVPPG